MTPRGQDEPLKQRERESRAEEEVVQGGEGQPSCQL